MRYVVRVREKLSEETLAYLVDLHGVIYDDRDSFIYRMCN